MEVHGMAKYDPLREHLSRTPERRITMHFRDIEALVGGLPQSAWEHSAWWGNSGGSHVHADAWMGAGYRVDHVDQQRGIVTFAKG